MPLCAVHLEALCRCSLYDTIDADQYHRYDVTVNFVQIYVEKIYDLLGERQVTTMVIRQSSS